MTQVTTTRDTSFTDRPGPGRHWYRIALLANYTDTAGDLMLFGPATSARTAR
jgi:hypothetical protein